MGRLQIDLVDLHMDAVVYKGVRYHYILTAMDVFSRFTWLRALKKKTSRAVAHELGIIFYAYGLPGIVQHDQGSEFRGEVEKLLQQFGIKQIVSSAYHPQSQGKVERMHRVLRRMIKHDLLQKKAPNWVRDLPKMEKEINDQPKQVLGSFTPFEVFFGRKRFIQAQNFISCSRIRREAYLATKKHNQRTIKHQASKMKTPTYMKGDSVFVRLRCKDSRVSGSMKYAEGKIVKQNLQRYSYKVQYDGNKVKWFSVRDIIAVNANLQKKRQS